MHQVFEVHAEPASQFALLRGAFGSIRGEISPKRDDQARGVVSWFDALRVALVRK